VQILIAHRYFWPDIPPYAEMLRSMAARFASDGHDVTLLSTQPSYNPAAQVPRQPWREQIDGFKVRRIWLIRENRSRTLSRVINAILFSLRVSGHILFNRYDVVMSATAPPVVVAAIGSRTARLRRTRFIYHCQDIHPESGQIAGLIRNALLVKLLRWLDVGTCNLADLVVALSEDMAETLRERGLRDVSKIRVINNFMVGEAPTKDAVPASLARDTARFRIIFAGNIGHFQGLEVIVDAMHRLEDKDEIELLLVGDGAAKQSLIERAGRLNGDRIVFIPYQPQSAVERLIAASDIGLITLRKGVYRVAYPSKTATYMKIGCPLLVCMEKASELARLTTREGIGVVVLRPDLPESVVEAIREARTMRETLANRRPRIIDLGNSLFGRGQVLDKWSQLIAELDSRSV
jgi:glycosyltransferase involved in cell wall biosynthesis